MLDPTDALMHDAIEAALWQDLLGIGVPCRFSFGGVGAPGS